MKKYLVVYFAWKNGESSVFGNCVFLIEEIEDIYTEKVTNDIREVITESIDAVGCVIINIIPLND